MKFRKVNLNKKQILKCYDKEIRKYYHFYKLKLTPIEVKRVVKLISSKYNIKVKKILFDMNSKLYGGWAHKNGIIEFVKETVNLMIVCHEVCHLICYSKGVMGHNANFYKQLTEIIKYVENNVRLKMEIK